MILSFTLSMPNIGSWNGKWTGANNLYARTNKFNGNGMLEKANAILNKGYFHYNFGDGWSAGVRVEKVDSKTAAKIRKASKGFCGYDWMIDSIINNLEIQTS